MQRGDAIRGKASRDKPDMIVLGLESFLEDTLPTLTKADVVVLLHITEPGEDATPRAVNQAVAALQVKRTENAFLDAI
jgi:hypothetical protein